MDCFTSFSFLWMFARRQCGAHPGPQDCFASSDCCALSLLTVTTGQSGFRNTKH